MARSKFRTTTEIAAVIRNSTFRIRFEFRHAWFDLCHCCFVNSLQLGHRDRSRALRRRRLPIEHLELNRALAIELLDLWHESQVERTHGQRFFTRPPPNCFA